MAERFVTYMTEDAEAGKVPVNGDGVLDPAKMSGGGEVVLIEKTDSMSFNEADELYKLWLNGNITIRVKVPNTLDQGGSATVSDVIGFRRVADDSSGNTWTYSAVVVTNDSTINTFRLSEEAGN